jgi:hypothetical protein
VKLAETYGVYRTARALRLNHDSLKKRVGSVPSVRSLREGPEETFVEVVPGGMGKVPMGEVPEYLIELENGRGDRMRIYVKGEAPDVAAMSGMFWTRKG